MTRRILFVTRTTGKGGLEKHLVDLICRMDRPGLSFTILCYGVDPFSEMLPPAVRPRVEVVTEPFPTGWLRLRRSLARRAPDTIVFVIGDLFVFPRSAYAAGRMSGASRVLAIIHNGPGTARSRPLIAPLRVLRELKRYVLGRTSSLLCHQTICVSRTIRTMLLEDYRYSPARTIAVPNGVDLDHYRRGQQPSKPGRENLGLGNANPVVVCVARLDPLKGIDVLLEAFVVIRRLRPAAACVIVGDGPEEAELRARCSTLGLDGAVTFVGHADDVRPYLAMSDMFVLPSWREGLSLSLLEAMAYGLPCVATDVGGNRELVVHGETGLVVKPGAAEELAEAVLYLAEHQPEREDMGLEARRRVEASFDVDGAMAQIESIILDPA